MIEMAEETTADPVMLDSLELQARPKLGKRPADWRIWASRPGALDEAPN